MPSVTKIAFMNTENSCQQITDNEGVAMFRAALNLFDQWELTEKQAAILLHVSQRTLSRWKAARMPGRLRQEGKARLSHLMGIHKSLRIIFREPHRGYSWIKAPNKQFGGKSALEVMLGGTLGDLMRVRISLEAEGLGS
jgi:uncharacterized protein (DUF2384 family)